jgi:hypothetical protein
MGSVKEDMRLTERETLAAQQEWVKEFGEKTGQLLTLPLVGALRDAVLGNAQINKCLSLVCKRIEGAKFTDEQIIEIENKLMKEKRWPLVSKVSPTERAIVKAFRQAILDVIKEE